MRQPTLGIWGPTQSGKTAYLAALSLKLNIRESPWRMNAVAGDKKTTAFLKGISKSLNKGLFPRATDIGGTYRVRFIHKRRGPLLIRNVKHRNKRYLLEFIDASGALTDLENEFEPEILASYFAYLRECDALLVMIDPDSPHRYLPVEDIRSYQSMILHLLEQLTANADEDSEALKRIKPSIAICITKLDLDEHWQYRNELRDYVRFIIGDYAFSTLLASCDETCLNFFGVSVVGRYCTPTDFERPNVIPTEDGYKIAHPKIRVPHQVSEPLLWLFDCIDQKTLTPAERLLRGSVSNDKV